MWLTQNAVCSHNFWFNNQRKGTERRLEGFTESSLERVGTQAGRRLRTT